MIHQVLLMVPLAQLCCMTSGATYIVPQQVRDRARGYGTGGPASWRPPCPSHWNCYPPFAHNPCCVNQRAPPPTPPPPPPTNSRPIECGAYGMTGCPWTGTYTTKKALPCTRFIMFPTTMRECYLDIH